jgi:hypothetical protein
MENQRAWSGIAATILLGVLGALGVLVVRFLK